MQPAVIFMCLLLVIPWVLVVCWFAFTNRRNVALLVFTVAPWLIAMFALIGFHLIAQADLTSHSNDPAFFASGIGIGYSAFANVGLIFALACNTLSSASFALYHYFYHHHHKHHEAHQNQP